MLNKEGAMVITKEQREAMLDGAFTVDAVRAAQVRSLRGDLAWLANSAGGAA